MNEAASAILMQIEAEGNISRLSLQLARLDAKAGRMPLLWQYSDMDNLAMAVLAHLSDEEHPQYFEKMLTTNEQQRLLQEYVQCVQQLYRVTAYDMSYLPAEFVSAHVYSFLADIGAQAYETVL